MSRPGPDSGVDEPFIVPAASNAWAAAVGAGAGGEESAGSEACSAGVGGANDKPGVSPPPGALVHGGSQRCPVTLTSAPPRANPPPRNPCGFWLPNFGSLWMTCSAPACACTCWLPSDGPAREFSSRTSVNPACVCAARTCCSSDGSLVSAYTPRLWATITGVL